MEGKTGRAKGKENTCRTVGITKALADRGYSTARKGFFYFFALKFGYSTETKKPNASPIRKVFGLFVCGRSDRIRTCPRPPRSHSRAACLRLLGALRSLLCGVSRRENAPPGRFRLLTLGPESVREQRSRRSALALWHKNRGTKRCPLFLWSE